MVRRILFLPLPAAGSATRGPAATVAGLKTRCAGRSAIFGPGCYLTPAEPLLRASRPSCALWRAYQITRTPAALLSWRSTLLPSWLRCRSGSSAGGRPGFSRKPLATWPQPRRFGWCEAVSAAPRGEAAHRYLTSGRLRPGISPGGGAAKRGNPGGVPRPKAARPAPKATGRRERSDRRVGVPVGHRSGAGANVEISTESGGQI